MSELGPDMIELPPTSLARFFWVLRQALLMIVRWIEKELGIESK